MTVKLLLPQPPLPQKAGAHPSHLDLLDGKATANQRQLRRNGLAGFQPETTAALLALFQMSGDDLVFLDVGANGGMYTMLCKLLFPGATAVAFEPHPDTAGTARALMAANDVAAPVEELAMSERPGTMELFLSERSDASHSLVERGSGQTGSVTVTVDTIDEYVARTGLVPKVMKLDVEGHEPGVLRGAEETLRRCRPAVVAEVLGDAMASKVEEVLAPHGYTGHRLGDSRDTIFFPGPLPHGFGGVLETWTAWVGKVGRDMVVNTEKYNPANYWRHRQVAGRVLHPSAAVNRWMARRRRRAFRRTVAGLPAKQSALDIGAGDGWACRALRKAGVPKVEAAEVGKRGVRRLTKRVGVEAFKCRVGRDPIPRDDGAYDLVTAIEVVPHIVRDAAFERALKEIARVLAPGGHLLVTDVFGDTDRYEVFDEAGARGRVPFVRHRSLASWQKAAEAAGLALEGVGKRLRPGATEKVAILTRLP